eukprot:403374052
MNQYKATTSNFMLYNPQDEEADSLIEEELKNEFIEEETITDKEFQRAMQKLKNRGLNAVPPKKSASAYIIFGKEKREEIIKKNPGLKVTEVVKQIAATWQSLSKTDRLKYKEASKRDRDRYEKELKTLEDFSDNLKKPKKCLSAYMIFTRPKIVQKNPDMGALQVMQEVGKQWQAMTTDQKKYFKQKADKDKVRYLNEQKAYYDEVEKVGLAVGTTTNKEGMIVVSSQNKTYQPKSLFCQKNVLKACTNPNEEMQSLLQKRKLSINNQQTNNQLLSAFKRIKTEEMNQYTNLQPQQQITNSRKGIICTESYQQQFDGKPIKPQQSVGFFTQALRNALRQKYPFLNDAQICKAVSYRWNQLSDQQKSPFQSLADVDKIRYEKEVTDLKNGQFKGKSKQFEISIFQEQLEVKQALEINDDLLIFLQVKKAVKQSIENQNYSQDTQGQQESTSIHQDQMNHGFSYQKGDLKNSQIFSENERNNENSQSQKDSHQIVSDSKLFENNKLNMSADFDNDKSQLAKDILKMNTTSSNNEFSMQKNLFSSNQLLNRNLNIGSLSQTIKNLASNLANNISQNPKTNNLHSQNMNNYGLEGFQVSHNIKDQQEQIALDGAQFATLQSQNLIMADNQKSNLIQYAPRQALGQQYQIVDENGKSYLIQAQPQQYSINPYGQIQFGLNPQNIQQTPSGLIISDNLLSQNITTNPQSLYMNPLLNQGIQLNPFQQQIEIIDINGVPTQVLTTGNQMQYIQQVPQGIQQSYMPQQNMIFQQQLPTQQLMQSSQQQQPTQQQMNQIVNNQQQQQIHQTLTDKPGQVSNNKPVQGLYYDNNQMQNHINLQNQLNAQGQQYMQ